MIPNFSRDSSLLRDSRQLKIERGKREKIHITFAGPEIWGGGQVQADGEGCEGDCERSPNGALVEGCEGDCERSPKDAMRLRFGEDFGL